MHSAALQVAPITARDEDDVEAFVLGHPHHGPGHRRAFAALDQLAGLAPCGVVARLEGAVVGIAPGVVINGRVVRLLRTRVMSGGSLVACGPLVSTDLSSTTGREVQRALVEAALEAARSRGVLRLGWIFPPVVRAAPPLDDADATQVATARGGAIRSNVRGPVLDLTQPLDALWREVNATTRNLIRRAEREGLRADTLTGPEAAEALLPFAGLASVAFGHRADAPRLFEGLRSTVLSPTTWPPLAHVTLVTRDHHPLGAVVTCESNGLGYYLLAFNTEEGLTANANRLALWRAIEASRGRGVGAFLLGSLDEGDGKAAAISRFKRQFGGSVVPAARVEWVLRPRLEALHAAAQTLVDAVRRRVVVRSAG